MTAMTKTVTVPSKAYQDHDDCLSAALSDVAEREGVEEWQCEAAWVGGDDGERNEIAVTVRG